MRKNYVWILLVVVVVVLFRLRTGGGIALPSPSEKLAAGVIRVPVREMVIPPSAQGEAWALGKASGVPYFAGVYMNGRLLYVFPAKEVLSRTSAGVLYASSGQIKFEKQVYRAKDIYVGTTVASGYIDFIPQ